VDRFDQALAALKAESKRLERKLNQIRAAIAALQGGSNNTHGYAVIGRKISRTLSASARKRIAAAQKARWAKWRASQRKRAA
jgi:hypothetical protein